MRWVTAHLKSVLIQEKPDEAILRPGKFGTDLKNRSLAGRCMNCCFNRVEETSGETPAETRRRFFPRCWRAGSASVGQAFLPVGRTFLSGFFG